MLKLFKTSLFQKEKTFKTFVLKQAPISSWIKQYVLQAENAQITNITLIPYFDVSIKSGTLH